MSNPLRLYLLALAAVLVAAPAWAQEYLTPEEKAQRELERRRKAVPVLICTPQTLRGTVRRDETATLRMTIKNGGGQTLKWSIAEMPEWLSTSAQAGDVDFQGKQEVVFTVNPASLADGANKTEIVIAAAGATGSPAHVQFEIQVTPPPKTRTEIPEIEDKAPIVPGRDGEAASSLRGLGLRAGLLVPLSGKKGDYAEGAALSVFWRPRSSSTRFGYEIEVAFSQAESESGLTDTSLMRGQADALWHFRRRQAYSAYALGGLALAYEMIDDPDLGSDSTLGATIDLGVGATLRGRFDTRLSYSVLLATKNVSGMWVASVGYIF